MPSAVSLLASLRVRAPHLAVSVLARLAMACADVDDRAVSSELVAPGSNATGAPACQRPRGRWRIGHEVVDPSGACVLLLRDQVRDFDAPREDPTCVSTLRGPTDGCTFQEEQRCHAMLGGAPFDSFVSRAFVLVSPDRLEGSGSARGSSADLGLCQTRFRLTGTPD